MALARNRCSSTSAPPTQFVAAFQKQVVLEGAEPQTSTLQNQSALTALGREVFGIPEGFEVMAFYEKVIKVKADVAAYLRLIAFHLHNPPVVTWGAVKGAPEQGAFILTLDSSPRHLQSSWERSATQFSWASFLSGFGFSSYWHAFRNASELSASIIPVRSRSTLIDASYPCVSQSLACNHHSYPASIRTLKEPHRGPVHVGVRSQTRPHHNRDRAWLVGCCHLFGDLDGSGHYPQSPEQGEWMSLRQTFPITNRPPRHQRIFCSLGFCLFRDCVG